MGLGEFVEVVGGLIVLVIIAMEGGVFLFVLIPGE
jgi:hypothetical protein